MIATLVRGRAQQELGGGNHVRKHNKARVEARALSPETSPVIDNGRDMGLASRAMKWGQAEASAATAAQDLDRSARSFSMAVTAEDFDAAGRPRR